MLINFKAGLLKIKHYHVAAIDQPVLFDFSLNGVILNSVKGLAQTLLNL